MRLAGRVAVITGGAGGIGREITRLFVENGASVLIADLLDEDGRDLESRLNENGTRVIYAHTDVTKSDEVQAAVARTRERFGPPEILVNCAGWLRVAMTTEVDEEYFDRTLASHVKGTWLFAKYC